MDALELSLKKAFIDHKYEGSNYDPQLIINQPQKKEFLLNTLQSETATCSEFFFSVAFITQSGLDAIKSQLADLARNNIHGRLLTSTYLAFNNPEVFQSLLLIPNLEVRISLRDGFHSKGYLFTQKDYYSFVIGSSNLTMNALKVNYEWNIRLTSYEHGEVIQQIQNHLESEWKTAKPLTQQWITEYAKSYKELPVAADFDESVLENSTPFTIGRIVPNAMQQEALANLRDLRDSGARRGLVISATGTGKTYLAAFDVQQFKPKHMLFIVHREQILDSAMESFMRVLPDEQAGAFGKLSGTEKNISAKYLFATIQTISKPEFREIFGEDYFDYILIDEVHKAGAKSYLDVIDYFKPKFLLGMTATPERTDNFNIFELFDYNIAYEIRLQDAIEENFLSPFHYFGVTDYEKDDLVISETTDLQYLVSNERVKFLLNKINYYGCSHNNPKGLIFCSRKDEARELSDIFNAQGVASTYLTGEDSIAKRELEVSRLESGHLKYIFTVDIFNEGIDIPKINQIVMLRNTQSSIVFIQQLGRGLRKHKSKDFVTIIDFIGNYKNNYMIPMALSGDTSRNKDNLRKGTFDTNFIAGLSAINFEEVAKERVFKSIDAVKLDSMRELRDIYLNFKNRLNHVPYLADFSKQNIVDPMLIANKLDSYYSFLVKMGDAEGEISATANKYLTFLSKEILPGIRRHEIILLSKMINENQSFSFAQLSELFAKSGLPHDEKTVNSVINTLNLSFFTGGIAKTYAGAESVQVVGDMVVLTDNFKAELSNDYFKKLVMDILTASFYKNERFEAATTLTRYQKYRRRDTLRLLGWKQQLVDQNIGGYTAKDGEFVIFVTIDKGDDFKGAIIAYEDALTDNQTMHWFTKSPRTLNSPEIEKLRDHDSWKVHVFAKKSDDEGTEFYYLGEVVPQNETMKQLEKPGREGKTQSVVSMDLKFKEPIDNNLYKYLI